MNFKKEIIVNVGGKGEKTRKLNRNSYGLEEPLKGVFAKNERGYRLNAIKKRF